MAYDGPQITDTFEAAGDLSAKQYHHVKLDANGKVVICAALTDVAIGILQNDPTLGQEALVCIIGITKVEAGEALDEGDPIGTAADGQADKRVIGTDTTHYVTGITLTAASGAAAICTAAVNFASPHRAA